MCNHQTEKFYETIAQKYHWFFSSWDKVMERQMKELVPLFIKHQVKNVLDCACGTGLQSIGLAEQGYIVTASDLSKSMLEIARKNAEDKDIANMSFLQSDFREIDMKVDSTFDAVICMGNSIPHLKKDNDILEAFKSVYRCLRHEGLALFDIRNYDEMLEKKERFLPMRLNSEKDGKSVTILYVFDYLEDIIRFNVVYLIEDLVTGKKSMDVETIDYNPIGTKHFVDLLKEAGFRDIEFYEVGANVHFKAIR